MAKGNLTKKAIEELAPGQVLWDTQVSGLGARCGKTGASFIFKTIVEGKQRMITIGQVGRPWTVTRARDDCHRILTNIADGDAPDTPTGGLTLQGLVDLYKSSSAFKRLKFKSREFHEGVFDKHILPALGASKVKSLNKTELAQLHETISQYAPTMANRVIATIKIVLNWAAKQDIVDNASITKGIEQNKEVNRDRILSAEELARFGAALKEVETDYPSPVACIRVLLFTGCRLREVLHLKWSEVDFEAGVLNLEDSKTGAKRVVVPTVALEILNAQPRVEGYVFPGSKPNKPRYDIKGPWNRILSLAKIEDFKVHDLRHTFASAGVGLHMGLPLIGTLLGQTQASTTERYTQTPLDPMKEASNKIASTLEQSLGQNSSDKPAFSVADHWSKIFIKQAMGNIDRSFNTIFTGDKVSMQERLMKPLERDENVGLKPLLSLLRSDVQLTREVKDWMIELFLYNEKTFKFRVLKGEDDNRRGRSSTGWGMHVGRAVWSLHNVDGALVKDAIAKVMDDYAMSKSKVEKAYQAYDKAREQHDEIE